MRVENGALVALALGAFAVAVGVVGRVELGFGESAWPWVVGLGVAAFAVGAFAWSTGDRQAGLGMVLGGTAVVMAVWVTVAADAEADRLEDEADRLEQEIREQCHDVPDVVC